MFRIAIAATAFSLSLSGAHAGDTVSPLEIARQVFVKADSDGNGALTEAEHSDAGLGRFGATFADLDLNNDDSISLQEYVTVFRKHHKGLLGRSA